MMDNDSYLNRNTDRSLTRAVERFDGYFDRFYKNPLISGNGFVFFSRPKLFITSKIPTQESTDLEKMAYQNTCSDPFFSLFLNGESDDTDKRLLEILSISDDCSTNWIKLFTNECKNFDPGDVNLDTMDVFETKQGYRIPMPTHSTSSTSVGQFSISMNETANIDITKLVTLWTKYIERVSNGDFRANPTMVEQGILDYMSSIYYFSLGPDGRSIVYWEKYTGVWIPSIPNSAHRYMKGDKQVVELSLTFNYLVKEYMDPRIFEDFNRVSLRVENDASIEYTEKSKLDYQSYKDSPLLNYSKLLEGSLRSAVLAHDRDPIVVYHNASSESHPNTSDAMRDRFELSFSQDDMSDDFRMERFSEYYDSDTYKYKL